MGSHPVQAGGVVQLDAPELAVRHHWPSQHLGPGDRAVLPKHILRGHIQGRCPVLGCHRAAAAIAPASSIAAAAAAAAACCIAATNEGI